jgi:hypothetical protein
LSNLTPFIPRSIFGNFTESELLIWSGGEIPRGGEAPSHIHTPLLPATTMNVAGNTGRRGDRGEVSIHQPRLNKRINWYHLHFVAKNILTPY